MVEKRNLNMKALENFRLVSRVSTRAVFVTHKVGCVFPMASVSILPYVEFAPSGKRAHFGSVQTRAPKKIEKNSLFFISVDEFSKLICCFLFSLIFSTNSTNQRNQRNEFNESTNKIFVDFIKFQRIFNENFNESTKISTNSTKISTNQSKFPTNLKSFLKKLGNTTKVRWNLLKFVENFEKSTKILFVDSLNSLTTFQINIFSLILFFKSTNSTKSIFIFQRNEINE